MHIHRFRFFLNNNTCTHLFRQQLPEQVTINAMMYLATNSINWRLNSSKKALSIFTMTMLNQIQQILSTFGWELLPHQPYFLDYAPSDYHLLRSLSKDLKDRKFENEDELKRYLQDFFIFQIQISLNQKYRGLTEDQKIHLALLFRQPNIFSMTTMIIQYIILNNFSQNNGIIS